MYEEYLRYSKQISIIICLTKVYDIAIWILSNAYVKLCDLNFLELINDSFIIKL